MYILSEGNTYTKCYIDYPLISSMCKIAGQKVEIISKKKYNTPHFTVVKIARRQAVGGYVSGRTSRVHPLRRGTCPNLISSYSAGTCRLDHARKPGS